MENNLRGFCAHLAGKETWYYLDTETTGLHDGEIVQLAVVRNDGQIEWNTLIKPVQPIPLDATVIHGITDGMVSDAPTFADIAPSLQDLLKGQTVVVYNAVYDRKMLHKSAERHNLERYDWKQQGTWLCAMEAYAEFFGDWNNYHNSYRWQPLTRAAQNCGVRVDNAHDAVADCIMTMGVANHMLKWYKEVQGRISSQTGDSEG